jgi:hypothetical protein
MNHDPHISLIVFSVQRHPRKQFLTTINLKALLRLVHPVIDRKESGAAFRANPIIARSIAKQWQERGEIQCLKPITIGISSDFCFNEFPHWKGSNAGTLELPPNAILDVCDGIQRLSALAHTSPNIAKLSETDWPVHLIETFGPDDLLNLTHQIRTQTDPILVSRRRNQIDHKIST